MGAADVNLHAFLPPGTTGTLADADEIDRYAANVAAFLAGAIPDDRFTAIRLQMGCYGQRQPGVNMVRVKAPGGRLDPDQLDRDRRRRSSTWSQTDHAHITTRESVQIHFVPLGRHARRDAPPGRGRPDDARSLHQHGAQHDGVHAWPASARASTPTSTAHLDAAVIHFLRNPLNQQMPRKFKISFSGCESDCAQGMLHDLGVIATRKDGAPGFKLRRRRRASATSRARRSSSTSSSPSTSCSPAMEAVITLHEKYSDRTKRAKSRIKFLVERFGAEGFVTRYRRRVRALAAPRTPPHALPLHRMAHADTAGDGAGPGRAARAARRSGRPGLVTVPVIVPPRASAPWRKCAAWRR